MSPQRATRAGRNLLIALLVGAVVIVAIVVAYVAGRGSSTTSADPVPVLSSAGTDTVTSQPSNEAAPTGCLGGPSRDIAMLLTAQRTAPHNAYGAVEVAAAFLRWAYRYPYPTAAQSAEAGKDIISVKATPSFRDVERSFASATDITGGQVPKGSPFYLSTTTGSWLVGSGSNSDRVTVNVSAPYVIDEEVSATKSAAISATLVWERGAWRLLSEQPPDASSLSAGGTQFGAGC